MWKCNNEDFLWQHAKVCNLTPYQVLEQLNKYSNDDIDGSFGHHELKIHGNKELQVCSWAIGSSNFPCKTIVEHSVVSRSLVHHSTSSYGLKVPMYRIVPHLLKENSPMVGNLIAHGT